jgi:hypothetical protein
MTFKTVFLTVSIALMATTAAPAMAKEADAPVATAPAPGANLYFIRVHAEPLLVGVTIHLDGNKIAEIANGNYTAVQLSPGVHKLKTTWPWWSSQLTVEGDLEIKAGEVQYLELTGRSRASGGTYGGGFMESGIERIELTDPDAALKECCTFKAPRVAKIGE